MKSMTTLASVTVPLAIGGVLSFVAWSTLSGYEEQATATDLQMDAFGLASSLDREVSVNFELLYSLKALSEPASLTEAEFRLAARDIIRRHPTIQALEWIPVVPGADRADAERAMQESGYEGFELTERMEQGTMVRAADRDYYYPVYYVEPYQGNEMAHGFDLGSNPKRKAALERARDTGRLTASESITLVNDHRTQKAFFAFVPVYGGSVTTVEKRQAQLQGYILGVYGFNDLLMAARLGQGNLRFAATLVDVTDDKGGTVLFSGDEVGLVSEGSWPIEVKASDVGGRKWVIRAAPTASYLAARGSALPEIALAIGLFVSALVAVALVGWQRRRDAIEGRRILEELHLSREHQLIRQDQLLSRITHQLGTPVANICQFVSILKDGLAGNISDEQGRYLDLTFQNASHLAEMVTQLGESSGAGLGKTEIFPMRVVLDGVFATVEGALAPRAKRAGIGWSVGAANRVVVYADPARIEQVLVNLVENAIKFTPAGGHISLSVRLSEDEPNVCQICVADTGPGIALEDQARIFDRLAHVDAHCDSGRQGLGLGLYISKELVTSNGGRIWVESTPGSGSMFCFTLPLFSFTHLLRPVFARATELETDIVLLTVRTPPTSADSSTGAVARRLGARLVRKAIFPEDIVLPAMFGDPPGTVHVLAAVDKAGAPAMAARIDRAVANEFRGPTKLPDVSINVVHSTTDATLAVDQRIRQLVERIEWLVRTGQASSNGAAEELRDGTND